MRTLTLLQRFTRTRSMKKNVRPFSRCNGLFTRFVRQCSANRFAEQQHSIRLRATEIAARLGDMEPQRESLQQRGARTPAALSDEELDRLIHETAAQSGYRLTKITAPTEV